MVSQVQHVNESTMVVKGDLIRDAALNSASEDQFQHNAIAGIVADVAVTGDPPLNIALYGPWGAGKSSFFALLRQKINEKDKRARVVRYDAWKYGGKTLKRNFITSLATELELSHHEKYSAGMEHDHESSSSDLAGWVWKRKGTLLVGLLITVLTAAAWWLLIGVVSWAVSDDRFPAALKASLTGLGSIASAVLVAVVFGPRMLEGATIRTIRPAPDGDDQFARTFEELVDDAMVNGRYTRLVIFIDELDRCAPDDVVSTLVDLKTFLDIDQCIFIVAADRDALERALRQVPQAKPLRDGDPYYSTPGAFLDKIFQHQIALPPLRPNALTRFAQDLLADQEGLWADLRALDADERRYLEVVYALVPVHVRGPRRVKVLLNNYATNVRIMQARGIDWMNRAAEIAVLSVLQTEFPRLATDLVRVPRLLTYLRVGSAPEGEELAIRLLQQYSGRPDESDDDTSTPPQIAVAGELLADDRVTQAEAKRANKVLNDQLRQYLDRVAAQNIPDPQPDLFYLETAGAGEGLAAELGRAIDLAADVAPDQTLAAFEDQTSLTKAVGIRLLVRQAEAERGPGRSNIIEAACRLAEQIDEDDLRGIATAVAPGVLSNAALSAWRDEATPGALRLGVIGNSPDLVSKLLDKYDADDLAEAGLLERLHPIFGIANRSQAAALYDLYRMAYATYSAPLHTALTSLPATAAITFWNAVSDKVRDVLAELAEPAPPPATTTARTSAAATPSQPPAEAEDPGERYSELLQSVEARTDDAQRLLSHVLGLGQRLSDIPAIAAIVGERSDALLERITDPVLRNLNAMAGLIHLPISDCAFWAHLLDAHHQVQPALARDAAKRLVGALNVTTSETQDVVAALEPIIRWLDAEDANQLLNTLQETTEKLDWSGGGGTPENRRALYAVAEMLRPAAGDEQVDAFLVFDLVSGLEADPDDEDFVAEALYLISVLLESSARSLAERLVDLDESPSVLRLAIAARRRFHGEPLEVESVAAIEEAHVRSIVASEWLALEPPVSDVVELLTNTTLSVTAVGTYASILTEPDRSKLWITLQGANASTAHLTAVGSVGVDETAVQAIAAKLSAASTQNERDALVEHLTQAQLPNVEGKREAIKLARKLLAGQIQGDGPLAAEIIIHAGGAVRGTTKELREKLTAFDKAYPKRLSKAQRRDLVALKLLPEQKKQKGLVGTVRKFIS